LTLFQTIAVPLLGLAAASQLFRAFSRSERHRLRHVLTAVVWLAAAATILDASITTWIAQQFGIGRGADLVLYVFVLVALAAGMHFHSRLERQRSEMTRLVRSLAIDDGLRRLRDPAEPVAPRA